MADEKLMEELGIVKVAFLLSVRCDRCGGVLAARCEKMQEVYVEPCSTCVGTREKKDDNHE